MDRKRDLNFDVPDWLDLGLTADFVQKKDWLLKTASGDQFKRGAPVLRRLVTDPRMQRVLSELDRRSRGNNGRPHLHGATVSPELLAVLGFDGSDPNHQRPAAKRFLFDVLFSLATLPISVIDRGGVKPRGLLNIRGVHRLSDIQINSADLAVGISDDGPAIRNWLRHLSLNLFHVVLCVDEVGLVVDSRVAVRNLRARCVGIGTASMCRELFGSYLYGTTATLTSVAVGEPVELTQIREWCSQISSDRSPVRPVSRATKVQAS